MTDVLTSIEVELVHMSSQKLEAAKSSHATILQLIIKAHELVQGNYDFVVNDDGKMVIKLQEPYLVSDD